MSHEYAKRHQILVLEVLEDEIVIAGAQPWVSSWESTIQQSQPGKVITRMIANPADIRRYTTEFYQMAKHVNQASAKGLATRCRCSRTLISISPMGCAHYFGRTLTSSWRVSFVISRQQMAI